ncbi:MAG TPA: bifunctional 4-hydroxy-2-oxoglutarate aldolase/2-dehydro-3-deoxy-phosphogluconate aldolase [Phycisphaerae bacterium]|nr:bifunctional 4-hydroxy-2-oxoglutarate aldolase/2-dehydro-3-deoxy-phosphogluconate aldolase [Phycisphaerae bacterium]
MNDQTSVVNEILQHRVSAIVRTKDQHVAGDAMRAAVDGGFRLVEFTMTTPGALELITDFAKKPELLVGAGTVLTVEQARAAVNAGARFLVSPVCDPEIIAEAHKLGVPAIPGTFTATEMETAHRAGADFVKLFPAPADLPSYIASILAPLPHLRIYPTNGVTVENVLDVLRAGAAGAGFAKALFEPAWLADRDFAAIRQRAAEITRRAAST